MLGLIHQRTENYETTGMNGQRRILVIKILPAHPWTLKRTRCGGGGYINRQCGGHRLIMLHATMPRQLVKAGATDDIHCDRASQ